MLDHIFGLWTSGVISILLFGEYPLPEEDESAE